MPHHPLLPLIVASPGRGRMGRSAYLSDFRALSESQRGRLL